MIPVLAFDIETVPDIAGLRKIHDIDAGVSDGQVAAMAFQRRPQSCGIEPGRVAARLRARGRPT